MKRTIKITVLRETFAPRGAQGADAVAGAAWCPACAAVSPLVTAEEALAFRGVAAGRRVFGGRVIGGVHFVEAVGGAPLVCLRSLLSGGDGRDAGGGGAVASKILNFRRDGE